MGKLAVIVDWPYAYIPKVYCWSLWQSDVRLERDCFIVQSSGPHSDLCFNASVKFALANGADEILSISCDQSVPPDILTRCRAHGKDVVGALYATRQQDHDWIIYQFAEDGEFVHDTPRKQLQRVAATGAGCFWAKADVFRKMPPPWFWTVTDETHTQVLLSNDFWFFRRCKEYGIEVYTDTGMVSDHQYEVMLNAQSLGRTLPPRMEIVSALPLAAPLAKT